LSSSSSTSQISPITTLNLDDSKIINNDNNKDDIKNDNNGDNIKNDKEKINNNKPKKNSKKRKRVILNNNNNNNISDNNNINDNNNNNNINDDNNNINNGETSNTIDNNNKKKKKESKKKKTNNLLSSLFRKTNNFLLDINESSEREFKGLDNYDLINNMSKNKQMECAQLMYGDRFRVVGNRTNTRTFSIIDVKTNKRHILDRFFIDIEYISSSKTGNEYFIFDDPGVMIIHYWIFDPRISISKGLTRLMKLKKGNNDSLFESYQSKKMKSLYNNNNTNSKKGSMNGSSLNSTSFQNSSSLSSSSNDDDNNIPKYDPYTLNALDHITNWQDFAYILSIVSFNPKMHEDYLNISSMHGLDGPCPKYLDPTLVMDPFNYLFKKNFKYSMFMKEENLNSLGPNDFNDELFMKIYIEPHLKNPPYLPVNYCDPNFLKGKNENSFYYKKIYDIKKYTFNGNYFNNDNNNCIDNIFIDGDEIYCYDDGYSYVFSKGLFFKLPKKCLIKHSNVRNIKYNGSLTYIQYDMIEEKHKRHDKNCINHNNNNGHHQQQQQNKAINKNIINSINLNNIMESELHGNNENKNIGLFKNSIKESDSIITSHNNNDDDDDDNNSKITTNNIINNNYKNNNDDDDNNYIDNKKKLLKDSKNLSSSSSSSILLKVRSLKNNLDEFVMKNKNREDDDDDDEEEDNKNNLIGNSSNNNKNNFDDILLKSLNNDNNNLLNNKLNESSTEYNESIDRKAVDQHGNNANNDDLYDDKFFFSKNKIYIYKFPRKTIRIPTSCIGSILSLSMAFPFRNNNTLFHGASSIDGTLLVPFRPQPYRIQLENTSHMYSIEKKIIIKNNIENENIPVYDSIYNTYFGQPIERPSADELVGQFIGKHIGLIRIKEIFPIAWRAFDISNSNLPKIFIQVCKYLDGQLQTYKAFEKKNNEIKNNNNFLFNDNNKKGESSSSTTTKNNNNNNNENHCLYCSKPKKTVFLRFVSEKCYHCGKKIKNIFEEYDFFKDSWNIYENLSAHGNFLVNFIELFVKEHLNTYYHFQLYTLTMFIIPLQTRCQLGYQFHLFIYGPPGSGKSRIISKFMKKFLLDKSLTPIDSQSGQAPNTDDCKDGRCVVIDDASNNSNPIFEGIPPPQDSYSSYIRNLSRGILTIKGPNNNTNGLGVEKSRISSGFVTRSITVMSSSGGSGDKRSSRVIESYMRSTGIYLSNSNWHYLNDAIRSRLYPYYFDCNNTEAQLQQQPITIKSLEKNKKKNKAKLKKKGKAKLKNTTTTTTTASTKNIFNQNNDDNDNNNDDDDDIKDSSSVSSEERDESEEKKIGNKVLSEIMKKYQSFSAILNYFIACGAISYDINEMTNVSNKILYRIRNIMKEQFPDYVELDNRSIQDLYHDILRGVTTNRLWVNICSGCFNDKDLRPESELSIDTFIKIHQYGLMIATEEDVYMALSCLDGFYPKSARVAIIEWIFDKAIESGYDPYKDNKYPRNWNCFYESQNNFQKNIEKQDDILKNLKNLRNKRNIIKKKLLFDNNIKFNINNDYSNDYILNNNNKKKKKKKNKKDKNKNNKKNLLSSNKSFISDTSSIISNGSSISNINKNKCKTSFLTTTTTTTNDNNILKNRNNIINILKNVEKNSDDDDDDNNNNYNKNDDDDNENNIDKNISDDDNENNIDKNISDDDNFINNDDNDSDDSDNDDNDSDNDDLNIFLKNDIKIKDNDNIIIPNIKKKYIEMYRYDHLINNNINRSILSKDHDTIELNFQFSSSSLSQKDNLECLDEICNDIISKNPSISRDGIQIALKEFLNEDFTYEEHFLIYDKKNKRNGLIKWDETLYYSYILKKKELKENNNDDDNNNSKNYYKISNKTDELKNKMKYRTKKMFIKSENQIFNNYGNSHYQQQQNSYNSKYTNKNTTSNVFDSSSSSYHQQQQQHQMFPPFLQKKEKTNGNNNSKYKLCISKNWLDYASSCNIINENNNLNKRPYLKNKETIWNSNYLSSPIENAIISSTYEYCRNKDILLPFMMFNRKKSLSSKNERNNVDISHVMKIFKMDNTNKDLLIYKDFEVLVKNKNGEEKMVSFIPSDSFINEKNNIISDGYEGFAYSRVLESHMKNMDIVRKNDDDFNNDIISKLNINKQNNNDENDENNENNEHNKNHENNENNSDDGYNYIRNNDTSKIPIFNLEYDYSKNNLKKKYYDDYNNNNKNMDKDNINKNMDEDNINKNMDKDNINKNMDKDNINNNENMDEDNINNNNGDKIIFKPVNPGFDDNDDNININFDNDNDDYSVNDDNDDDDDDNNNNIINSNNTSNIDDNEFYNKKNNNIKSSKSMKLFEENEKKKQNDLIRIEKIRDEKFFDVNSCVISDNVMLYKHPKNIDENYKINNILLKEFESRVEASYKKYSPASQDLRFKKIIKSNLSGNSKNDDDDDDHDISIKKEYPIYCIKKRKEKMLSSLKNNKIYSNNNDYDDDNNNNNNYDDDDDDNDINGLENKNTNRKNKDDQIIFKVYNKNI